MRAYRPSRWDLPADKERKKNGTPCETCRPQIERENQEAVEVYCLCQDQLKFAGMEGVAVAPDIPAIESVLRIRRVPLDARLDILERVLKIFRAVIGKRNAIRERRSSNKSANR